MKNSEERSKLGGVRHRADWMLDIFACPLESCLGRLEPRPPSRRFPLSFGVLRCIECHALFPVLSGVPVLTTLPGLYLATYRESICAALVEQGSVGTQVAGLLDSFAADFANAEPMRFGDDWVASERFGRANEAVLTGGESALSAYRRWLQRYGRRALQGALTLFLENCSPNTVVEVGSGAGLLSHYLATRAHRLLVCDLSFRATLISRQRATGCVAKTAAAAVDAETLPLQPGSVDTLVAANLVDLLDHPESFLRCAKRALTPGGRLVLTSPDPELGRPAANPPEVPFLLSLLAAEGFVCEIVRDGLPWLRAHDPRHHDLYFVMAIVARPSEASGV